MLKQGATKASSIKTSVNGKQCCSLCYLAAGDDAVKWRETYMDNIAKMLLSGQQTKPDQFITCVHRLHLHFPPIADK